MPSKDLLKRLEALNGKPLQHVPEEGADGATDAAIERPVRGGAKRVGRNVSIKPSALPDSALPVGVLAALPEVALDACLPGTACSLDGRGAYYRVERPAAIHAPWTADLHPRLGRVLEQ